MSRLIRAGALALLLSVPVAVRSQTAMHFNIAAGASIPTSDFGTLSSTGYHFMAGIAMTPPNSPLGFRLEGIYNEFGQNNNFGNPGSGSFTDQNAHAGGVTINATYNVLQPSSTQSNTLYVIGGVGYYNTIDRFELDSQNNVGYNFGAGFKFPLSGFSAYLEARYHTVQNVGVTFVPISFGLVF